jgi:gamma-glutamylcyclotransferase (GGCT)/AIG2-like uncharacterized protein YtfP
MSSLSTLFVYGTLCKPALRRRVLGRTVTSVKAVLKSWQRRDGKWPYLVKKPGSVVKGEILQNLTARDFKKLDAYEWVGKGVYVRVLAIIGGEKVFVYLPGPKWPKSWN